MNVHTIHNQKCLSLTLILITFAVKYKNLVNSKKTKKRALKTLFLNYIVTTVQLIGIPEVVLAHIFVLAFVNVPFALTPFIHS